MLEVHFIENFPVGNRIVITRLVLLSVLVLKSTFGVPSQESCIVVRNFLERGVAQFRTLFIVPQGLVRIIRIRSEEHTSELQSRGHLVCRLLLEKKKKK